MAPVTDLTFQQISDKLPAGVITLAGGVLSINMTALLGASVDALTDTGVVKGLGKLFDAGYQAQITANEGQAVGERLAAFGAPAAGGTVNGYTVSTCTFTKRSELASAVNVLGQVA